MIQIGKHPSSRFSLKPIKSGLCHSIYPVRGFAEYLDCIFVSACRPGSVPCGETGGSVEDGKRKGLLYPVAYCCDVLLLLSKRGLLIQLPFTQVGGGSNKAGWQVAKSSVRAEEAFMVQSLFECKLTQTLTRGRNHL
jgi:hypothetical protein